MESVTCKTSFTTHAHKRLTKLAFVPMTRAVRGKPLVINPDAHIYKLNCDAMSSLAHRLLTRPGNLPSMTAEHELLDVIGHRLTQ